MTKLKKIAALICAVCVGISLYTVTGLATDVSTAAPASAAEETAAPTSTPQVTAVPDEKDIEKATEIPMPTSAPKANTAIDYSALPDALTVTPNPNTTLWPESKALKAENEHITKEFEKEIGGWNLAFGLYEPEEFLSIFSITKVSPNASKTLTIPAVVDGYWVAKVGGIASRSEDAPEKIIFSEGIRDIELFNSDDIKEVVLPSTIKSIAWQAFEGTSIKKLTIKSADCLSERSLAHMEKLEEVILPESVTVIPDGCFAHCSSLKKIELPLGLTRLEQRAFSHCTALESINIPNGIKNNLSTKIFIECTSLKNVSFNGEITGSMVEALVKTPFIKEFARKSDNKMFVFNNKLYSYAGSDKNVVIPGNVTEIVAQCFKDMDITSVTFPSGLRTIGDQAFLGTKLKEVHIPASVKKIGQWAFSKIDTLEKLVIDDENQFPMLSLGAFEGCGKLSDVTLPKSASIASQAFLDTPFGGNDMDEWYVTSGMVPERPSSAGALPKPTAVPDSVDMNDVSPDEKRVLSVKSENDVISVSVLGKGIRFTDALPFIDENDRTQMPVRAVAESIGCKVDYDDASKTVKIDGDDENIVLRIGDERMDVNGKTVEMDTAARIVNDRTYIPVRFIAEALGYEVYYQN